MKKRLSDKRIARYILLCAALILAIIYFGDLLGILQVVWGIVFPLVLGFGIAYLLNIPMKRIEGLYFPATKSKFVDKTRRAVSICISIVLILAAALLIVNIVFPQVGNAITSVAAAVPVFAQNINLWIEENREQFPIIMEQIGELNLDWSNISKSIADYAGKGISGLFTSTIGIITTLTSGVFNLFIAFAFAVYLLAGKERLLGQVKRIGQAFLKQSLREKLARVLSTANECFTSFITGQCVEAVILGVLCTIGMWIFRFPYATTVGVFVGATALIPIFGAYLGAGVGAFLILMEDPLKAVFFIIYIIILQQLENNLIYPRVVGTSIGLPGIWVLLAITVGGGLGGIPGMLLGVPVMATCYKLLQLETRERLRKQVEAAGGTPTGDAQEPSNQLP